MKNFKDIHIGSLLSKEVKEKSVDILRICSFFNLNEIEIESMYTMKDLSTDTLMKWSKLLDYDFFRLYSQHLILYSPPSRLQDKKKYPTFKSSLPQFRKNLYTIEIIDFLLLQIKEGTMTKNQIIDRYNIPKTTLYKWIKKYEK